MHYLHSIKFVSKSSANIQSISGNAKHGTDVKIKIQDKNSVVYKKSLAITSPLLCWGPIERGGDKNKEHKRTVQQFDPNSQMAQHVDWNYLNYLFHFTIKHYKNKSNNWIENEAHLS